MKVSQPKGVFPTGGKGRKPCPHDPSHYLASRMVHCPVCKKDLEAAHKPKKVEPTLTEKAIATVEDMGGIAAVRKHIDVARKALEALKPLGGLDDAEKTVALMERLKKL